ncbi:putative sugar nucleotidyl transferase [Dyadobacter arcticus]|uniref:UDP-N-acetylglucosamine diphosphorylase/glucosamine-1-phosphate N-acetyltransferase n=1 Tax=Dyadobacter arcticus TaxID=1078754 RepID=A0ABX0UQG6_9BACT|nr:putative sugar nucleotidyl transferase [Dyadobacter arcticus]NIJ55238.1 UDP-N-acetylglucosamine diphosphorylase/glucosamine-1-phosphate N-acetyltransferase [Dyadobacter arcticus]
MPDIVLFDDPILRVQLLPLTYTRPIAAIRCGIRTISQKWEEALQTTVSFQTETYLSSKFPAKISEDPLFINGALCPNAEIVQELNRLAPRSGLISEKNEILAVRTDVFWNAAKGVNGIDLATYTGNLTLIRNVWDIFSFNGAQIKADFERITASKSSLPISDPFTHCYNPDQIFIEEGAVIKASVLNAENGPIYIGCNAFIQEGSLIQGPFAIGESSVLAQGTKIRPNTTIGPFCKVGGEVSNCVFFGYSNKGHDGYLGNSVIGEWCNLGANTNNSNLKNDHSLVKLHSYFTNSLADTGLLFCGLIMGDFSKAGISTMFNTGSVVGVSVNVFGAGFQNKHIPSFSWGGAAEGITEYRFQKALEVAKDTVNRRGVTFGGAEEDILRNVFEETQLQR